MPKGGKVDRAIRDVMRTGKSESSAIRILKARRVIQQLGRHLIPAKK